jgi:hypothetical protein
MKTDFRTQKGWRSWLFLISPAVVFCILAGYQILGPVPIGVSNNDDFARVLGPLRLWPSTIAPGDRSSLFRFFVPEYKVADPKYDIHVPSTEWLVAYLGKASSRIVLGHGLFDLRVMGVIHMLLLALALVLFNRALRRQPVWLNVVGTAWLVWMWADVMYVQQFNTAYSDAGALVGLCIAIAIATNSALAEEPSCAWAIGFAIAGSFMEGAKTQHVPAVVPFSAFAVLMALRARRWRNRIAWLGTPVILCGVAIYMVEKLPDDYKTEPSFSIVFWKLAVLSKNPRSVLDQFHLPGREFDKYIGHYFYEPIVPAADEGFRRRIRSLVPMSAVAAFYARNPDMLKKVIEFDWKASVPDVDMNEYGRMRESDVAAKKQAPVIQGWSRLRKAPFRIFLWYPVIFFAVAFAGAGAGLASTAVRQRFPLWPIPLMSTLVALACFALSSLVDAVETTRHLVIFQAATDLTIFTTFLAMFVRWPRLVASEPESLALKNKQATPVVAQSQ